MNFECSEVGLWKEALSSYSSRIESLNKPNLLSLDDFYRNKLPPVLHQRNPNPYITTTELSKLMQWKLTRGKWRYSLYPSLPLSLSLSKYIHLKCNVNVMIGVYVNLVQAAFVGLRFVLGRGLSEFGILKSVSISS